MPRRILSIVPKDAFSKTRGLIRMSWDKRNLENLVDRRTPQDLSKMTVFQQKWVSKRELRGYHVSNITERQFLNRHFDPMLPNRQLSPKEKNEIPPIQALAFVNGEKCRYPARRLQDGDMITVAPRSIPTLAGKTDATLRFKPFPYMSPWMFTPAYLEVDYTTCSTVFLRSPVAQPNAVEIPSPLPPTFHQLAFEWYAPIKRARKVLPRDPLIVCGQTVKLKPKFDSIMRMDQKNRLTELRNKIAAKREKRSAERHLRAEEKQGEETSA
ncbi:hypothetical protein BASA62_002942 [Batrachochytrium salamandrivorans]|nr:hypothetical protein BASA62_002942 [Batrachochytrium salamandrivorans]